MHRAGAARAVEEAGALVEEPVKIMEIDRAAEEEELRLLDHNENMDAMALFGVTDSAPGPIDLDAPAGAGTGTGSTSPAPTASTAAGGGRGGLRKRTSTSKVWDDFDEVFEVQNSKRVRVSAVVRTLCLLDPLLVLGTCSGIIAQLRKNVSSLA